MVWFDNWQLHSTPFLCIHLRLESPPLVPRVYIWGLTTDSYTVHTSCAHMHAVLWAAWQAVSSHECTPLDWNHNYFLFAIIIVSITIFFFFLTLHSEHVKQRQRPFVPFLTFLTTRKAMKHVLPFPSRGTVRNVNSPIIRATAEDAIPERWPTDMEHFGCVTWNNSLRHYSSQAFNADITWVTWPTSLSTSWRSMVSVNHILSQLWKSWTWEETQVWVFQPVCN